MVGKKLEGERKKQGGEERRMGKEKMGWFMGETMGIEETNCPRDWKKKELGMDLEHSETGDKLRRLKLARNVS